MRRTGLFRMCLTAASLAALVNISGCFPKGVVWLPDSSGVVFAEKGDGSFALYDLKSRGRKTVVKDVSQKTPWPALRADGKRLAVAKVESTTKEGSKTETTRTEIKIYDLDGRLLKQSRPLVVSRERPEPAPLTNSTLLDGALNWCGPADKILTMNAIYDCERDEWTKLNVELFPLNNTPVRPDGKGFFAGGDKAAAFVDWEGRVSTFAGELPEDFSPIAFEWDDKIARLIAVDGVHEFDTGAMRYTYKARDLDFVKGEGKPSALYRFPGGDVQLCVFDIKAQGDDKPTRYRVEVQFREAKTRRTLFGEDEIKGVDGFFFPSPDGKKTAFVVNTPKDDDLIVIVNDAGDVVARIVP